MEDFIIQFVEAAAVDLLEKIDIGRHADAGFDAGEFSGSAPRKGEEEACAFLQELRWELEWEIEAEHEAWMGEYD
jgi:hypothetical protein